MLRKVEPRRAQRLDPDPFGRPRRSENDPRGLYFVALVASVAVGKQTPLAVNFLARIASLAAGGMRGGRKEPDCRRSFLFALLASWR